LVFSCQLSFLPSPHLHVARVWYNRLVRDCSTKGHSRTPLCRLPQHHSRTASCQFPLQRHSSSFAQTQNQHHWSLHRRRINTSGPSAVQSSRVCSLGHFYTKIHVWDTFHAPLCPRYVHLTVSSTVVLCAVTLTSSPIWHTIPIISLESDNRLLFVVDTNCFPWEGTLQCRWTSVFREFTSVPYQAYICWNDTLSGSSVLTIRSRCVSTCGFPPPSPRKGRYTCTGHNEVRFGSWISVSDASWQFREFKAQTAASVKMIINVTSYNTSRCISTDDVTFFYALLIINLRGL
jgi:hypothetical protein